MIVFRYSKTLGAEYISHLDTLRHLNKTFVRAGIAVKSSQGFHPHKLVYMSSPIGVGLKSLAEYCTVDTDEPPESFIKKFNEFSPKGIKCLEAYYSPVNVNLAAEITEAKYVIEGLSEFAVEDVLAEKEFIVKNKKGEPIDVRGKIHSLKRVDGGIEAILSAGNDSLRPDIFSAALKEKYGGEHISILKLESFASGNPVVSLIEKNGSDLKR